MAEVTAAMVKALRDATSAGMMDCKKALDETGGDLEAAKDTLRAKGIAKAETKAGRATSEGLIAIKVDGASATMVEVRCETDFTARNDEFQAMIAEVAELAAGQDDGETEATERITARVQAAFAKIGENMGFARGRKISAAKIGTYVHFNGKVGVIVGLDKDVADDVLADLCMHIAFADPMGITADDIPAEIVEKENRIAKQEAIDSGKPAEIAEKIVTGKINKFLAANALMEQPFVKDDKKKIKEILGGAAVTAFARFAVGG